jgi:hypothetical protein
MIRQPNRLAQASSLNVAVMRLAILLEDQLDRFAGLAHDQLIQIGEFLPETVGEPVTNGRFAAAAIANECDIHGNEDIGKTARKKTLPMRRTRGPLGRG